MINKLTASDGHAFNCWIESAQGESKGGLIILQEIFGVTDQLKGLASRYAKLGYDVAIPALFDRQQRDAIISFDDPLPGRDLMLAIDLSQTMDDVNATVQALADKGDAVVVMGFCWGGGLAIRAAQKLNIAGAISFYGTRLPEYLDCPLKAPVLGHFGSGDEHVPPEMLDQARAYLPDMEVHMYDAGHGFANDAREGFYHKESAEKAHQRNEVFLQKILG